MENSSAVSYRASSNYIYRRIADKHVLVAIGAGIADFRGYIQLNESAALLWKSLKDGATRNSLVDAFVDAFEVDTITAEKDIDKCLDMLKKKGLIVAEGDG